MKQNKFKLLGLSVILLGGLVLAGCDKVSQPTASQPEQTQTQVQTPSTETPTTTAQPANTSITTLEQADVPNVTLGYDTTPEQLVRQLQDALIDPKPEKTKAISAYNYVQFWEQIGLINYGSEAQIAINKFADDFAQKMADNKSLYSIHLAVASDIAQEGYSLIPNASGQSDYLPAGWPKVPTSNTEGLSYVDYRNSLINAIKKDLRERISVYADKGYQDRYFLDDDGLSQQDKAQAAAQAVEGYIKVLDLLLANDLIVRSQVDKMSQIKALRAQMLLLLNIPTVIAQNTDINDKTEKQMLQHILEGESADLIGFFNAVVRPLDLEVFTSK